MRVLCLMVLLAAPAIAQEGASAPAPVAPAEPGAPSAAENGTPETSAESLADRRVRRLSDELRSPFCPGKTIMTCTSSQAYTLRQEMREMVLAGQSDEAIIAALALRYGDEIVNPPQPWYTVLVPFLPFILGGALVIWIFRRWRRGAQRADPAPPPDPADAEALARLRARVATPDEE